jgi:predicted DNA-binding transcriptional regulator AlpA
MTTATGERLISAKTVAQLLDISKARLYQILHEADARFPKPTRFGASVRWSLLEVEKWMRDRLDARP